MIRYIEPGNNNALFIVWEEGLVSGEVIEITITPVNHPYKLGRTGIPHWKNKRQISSTVVKPFELREVVERSLRSDFMEETLERITGCESELVIRRGTMGDGVILQIVELCEPYVRHMEVDRSKFLQFLFGN